MTGAVLWDYMPSQRAGIQDVNGVPAFAPTVRLDVHADELKRQLEPARQK